MNIVRELAGALFKMFVGDAMLTAGILLVVSLAGLLTRSDVVPSLVGGAILVLGCVLVLVASVALSVRRLRNRRATLHSSYARKMKYSGRKVGQRAANAGGR